MLRCPIINIISIIAGLLSLFFLYKSFTTSDKAKRRRQMLIALVYALAMWVITQHI